MIENEGYKVFISGKQFPFYRHMINGFYQLPTVDERSYQQLVATSDYDAIMNYLTKNRRSLKRNSKNEQVNFQTKHQTKIFSIWHHFVISKIAPKSNISKFTKEMAIIEYAIL